ncbi:MAG: hypothetical protein J3R72DRAFT_74508 [Linnemannia gamsii]|nr:MAG: hypothetical protein J3R72DRAFT_74508 [Linnemannia gamsii]
MNILQHKSWHVYSQKNQERVKRDEAKAEAEEKQTQERAISADREHRLTVLRQRAARRHTNGPGLGEDKEEDEAQPGSVAPGPNDTLAVIKPTADHVNFWADLEKKDTSSKKGNPEYEAEVKAKEKKWERTIAMHLDSAIRGPTPWYTTPTAGSMTTTSKKNDDNNFVKIREDPLQNMRSMLDKRKVAQEEKGERQRSRSPSSRKHARTSGHRSSQLAIKGTPEVSTMAKLRMERLFREQAEKSKAMALLNPDYIDPTVHHQSTGRYNQQFNPQATTHAHSASRSYHRDRPFDQRLSRESRDSRSPDARMSHENRHQSSREEDRHQRSRESASRGGDRLGGGPEDRHGRNRDYSGRHEDRHRKENESSRRRDREQGRDDDRSRGESSRSHHDSHNRLRPHPGTQQRFR